MSNMLDKLRERAKAAKNGGEKSYGDGNEYYYPARDASGNGSAVIRFLPAKSEDDPFWAQIYSHGFKGPAGKWFIAECPTTIQEDCPLCALNSETVAKYGKWEQVPEEVKNVIRERKRKMNYVANILVVSDPKNPENEGKVMLFKFGAKIFDKIMSALDPEFDDIEACDIFHPVEGANFKFRIRKVEGQTNYDKSEFDVPSPIKGSKAEVNAILDQVHDLNQFFSPEKFKSFDALKTKLDSVLGNTVRMAAKAESNDDDVPFETEATKPQAKPQVKKEPVAADDDDSDIAELLRKIEAGED